MMFLYALTLFASALLLFLVQPMVGKMILPKLGGTPAVWNTCMVFFQAMLLAGYAYAHGTAARLNVRRQAILHLLVLLVPLAVLPIAVAEKMVPPATDSPTGWLLLQLFIGVGLPFFVVSSSAPLLQTWFSRTGHRDAGDPYFLYAASNAGSLLALLGYPLLVEPNLPLARQSQAWAWGYALVAGLIAICAAAMWRPSRDPVNGPAALPAAGRDRADPAAPIGLGARAWWVLLAAIPSSLMLGVTTYITTDLAAVPLMWVLPLAIYLLTFVLVFAKRCLVPHAMIVKLVPFLVLPMGILFFFRLASLEWLLVPVHLISFFAVAMLCHGELVRRRPGCERLTEFYLLMSVGGVLGGLFNAVVAPQVFTGIVEYPLVMVAACFALPRTAHRATDHRERLWDFGVPALIAAVVAVGLASVRMASQTQAAWAPPVLFLAVTLACFSLKARPVRFALSYGVMVLAMGVLADWRTGDVLHAERNFFGVKRVLNDPSGRLRLLVHGTTTHGCQMRDPARAGEPSSYYHRSSPIGDLFAAFNASPHEPHVGVIGLGAGAVAAYAQPGQRFTFYEIDPGMERIARDPRYFTYLADSRGACEVVLGDGRLTLARVPDGRFGFFLLDAFSSDSVPTHLLAREAIELYVSKLADGGLLAFHVSNRFFDFEPLLAKAADDLGLACAAKLNTGISEQDRAEGKLPSHCVVMARQPEDLAALLSVPGWRTPDGSACPQAWTDQHCDVVGLFLAGKNLSLGPRPALAKPR